jgi:hypothetical protein
MSGLALGIVLVAGFFHAGWNFLIKKSRNKIAFIWLEILVSTIVYFPMFLYFWPKITISAAGWACVVATGICLLADYHLFASVDSLCPGKRQNGAQR